MTKIPTGYLIGRVLAPEGLGPGPWWEYIAIVASETDAKHQAATLARLHDVCAWLHKSGDEYDRLWPDPNEDKQLSTQ